MQVAYEAGVQVTLDCGGIEAPVTPELLRSVSIISPNETELARITGQASYCCMQTPFDHPGHRFLTNGGTSILRSHAESRRSEVNAAMSISKGHRLLVASCASEFQRLAIPRLLEMQSLLR